MRKLAFLFFLLLTNYSFSQTTTSSMYFNGNDLLYQFEFSYTNPYTFPSNTDLNSDIIVSNVPASYKLVQVEYQVGDGSTSNSGSLSPLTVTIKHNSTSATTLFSYASDAYLNQANHKSANHKFRIHNYLKTVANQKQSDTYGNFYPFVGYYSPNQNWINPSNVNGTWRITSKYNATNSTDYPRKIHSIRLIFGPSETVETISFTTGSNCSNAREIKAGIVYLSSNRNTQYNQNDYPILTNWNGYRNSTAWYYYIATNSTARISINGFGQLMQSIAVTTDNNNPCFPYVTSNSPYTNIRATSSATNYQRWNFEYNLSNLTVGKRYYILVDGDGSSGAGGAIDDFYIYVESKRPTALPINLSSFTATQENNRVKLDWLTASEKDNDYFTLYRSADGVNWNEIGQVQGNGTSSVENSYQFVDRQPKKGTNYYKLKQTDFNGEFEEFDPISVEFNGETNAINIYPNPTENDIHIRWEKPIDSYSIQLIDLTGKVIQEYNQSSNEVFNETTFETNFIQNGTYLIRIESNGEIKTEKITIIK